MNDGKRIGFIGMGVMGGPMARRLAAAGFSVKGFDIADTALQALAAAGGTTASSPAEAAEGADLLMLVVATADQAETVLWGRDPGGNDGAVGSLRPGATVALHSTAPPEYVDKLGARLAAKGLHILDAPISGGKVGAESGKLTVMASGSTEAFAAMEAVFPVVAGKVYRLGDTAGIGSRVKLVNQLLAGVHIAAAAEAMALGTRTGADPKVLYEVISNSAGNSWMFTNRVPHMVDGDFTPTSAVEIFVKDLGIVLDAGRSLRFPLPITAAAHQQYLAAAAAGHGREDDSAVVKVYQELAGIDVAAAAKKAKA
jgi:3-hydroxyisobutyrate dehydrogenase